MISVAEIRTAFGVLAARECHLITIDACHNAPAERRALIAWLFSITDAADADDVTDYLLGRLDALRDLDNEGEQV